MAKFVRERYASIDDNAKISYIKQTLYVVSTKSVRSEKEGRTPKPTRVAILELQLHDLQKAEAAVPPDK